MSGDDDRLLLLCR